MHRMAFFCAVLLGFSFSLLHASFEDTGAGARATALGGAFTAAADDVYAIYYNPSGLAFLSRKELTASYAVLYGGLSDHSQISNSYIAYAHPIGKKAGAMGFSWNQTSLSGLYTERTIAASYALRLAPYWTAGVNVKNLYRSFVAPVGRTSNLAVTDLSGSDPVFANNDSKSNFAIDVGYLFRPRKNYSLGMSFENINEPNMAIASSDSDRVHPTIRGGFAYRQRTHLLSAALVTLKTTGEKRDYFFTTGGEKLWDRLLGSASLALRASLSVGSRDFSQMAFGVGYQLSNFSFDYAFVMPLSGITFAQSFGTHRVSVNWRFGKVVQSPEFIEENELAPMGPEKVSSPIAIQKVQEELDSAKQEFDRLLRQVDRMNQETQSEVDRLRKETEQWKDQAEKVSRETGDAQARQLLSERVSESMNHYWKSKFSGATLDKRIKILTEIERKFAASGIDLTVIGNELRSARAEKTKQEGELELSWSYYEKIVARGASVSDRIRLLSRLVERFAPSGLDLTRFQEEIERLKVLK